MQLPIGYTVALDRFRPQEAVELAALADDAGFAGACCGDNFQPALAQHGQAGFMWSVLAAMGARTRGVLGGITTPGYRMHPALVAQAAATLASLHPDRHWVAVASGEARNEHVVGGYWPEPPERIARMFEAVEIIKKLFGSRDKDVRYSGRYHQLETTRLWTLPTTPPPVLVATSGPATARRAGRTADGLLTIESTPERLEVLVRRFEQGAREAGRDPARLVRAAQVRVSWAATDELAMEQALAGSPESGLRFSTADLRSPFILTQAARAVRAEDLAGRVLASADPRAHRAHLQRYADLGFTHVYVQQVGTDQQGFLRTYAEHVLGG
ncbi:TIGR03557 family F420-dependent LLM class oxidoreductase [Flexivirga sp. B27]